MKIHQHARETRKQTSTRAFNMQQTLMRSVDILVSFRKNILQMQVLTQSVNAWCLTLNGCSVAAASRLPLLLSLILTLFVP